MASNDTAIGSRSAGSVGEGG